MRTFEIFIIFVSPCDEQHLGQGVKGFWLEKFTKGWGRKKRK